jgi:hypothetical protein
MDLSTRAGRQQLTARLREIYETLRRERQFEQNILMPGWDQLNVDIMNAILRSYLQGAADMRGEQRRESENLIMAFQKDAMGAVLAVPAVQKNGSETPDR